MRHAEWGRASYGGPWGGPQGRRAFDSDEAPSSRFTANTGRRPGSWGPVGGAAKRALETGPGESDLLSNALSATSAMPGLEVLDLSHNQLRNLEDAGVTNLPWLVELKVRADINKKQNMQNSLFRKSCQHAFKKRKKAK